ncbi:uncharacterized protein LOC111290271 [Durio zibethinus]|uniref:Uncharacterized protein LOC111290271 n=1 Tax=Durio zibethinus TaxID=66656 RepID=A0A6P5YA37_DURZI|nr:uncharacterized protein LOC111290271 [Durio zibethinus]
MDNLRDRTSRRWPSRIAEKFVPISFWTEDAEGNYLLDIDLRGFKPEEVRIELPSADHIKIEGERIVNENKCIYIDQTVPLPENSDTENIVGKFKGEHLHITVPKRMVEQNKEEESKNGNGNKSSAEGGSSQEEEESNDNGENKRKHEHGHVAAKQSHDSNETRRVASFPEESIKKWEEKDGFQEEEVMVGLAYPGHVTISGERIVNNDKCIYFAQTLQRPATIDMNKTGQNFEDEMLCLTFPKRVEEKNENGNPAAEKNAQEELMDDENKRKHDEHGHAENEEQGKQTEDHVVSVHKEMRNKGSAFDKKERGHGLEVESCALQRHLPPTVLV